MWCLMPWFYNSISGELANESGAAQLAYQAALHTGTGWHELNISGSASFAQAAAEALKEVPGGATPTGSAVQGLQNVPGSVAGAAASSISSSILGPLFQSNIWLRVAEVLIGVVLIGIGLNAMLKGKPLQVVTNTAGMAAKVVP
jgi:hypothetical protein